MPDPVPALPFSGPAPREDAPFGAHTILAGAAIVVATLAALLAWSILAPIESAVVAPGVVAVETNTKTVQHLEGGIVEGILVREGEAVTRGQTLIRLSDTLPAATYNEVRSEYVEVRAALARLEAERDGRGEVAMPADLADDEAAQAAFAAQRTLFASRAALRAQKRNILQGTTEALGIEVEGLETQVAAERRRLALLREELEGASTLLAQGLTPRPRVLALQREEAEIEGAIGERVAAIGMARQRMQETLLRIAELDAAFAEEVDDAYGPTRARAYELAQKLAAAQDVMARTEIRSPIDGIVVGLQVHTVGAVVASGQALLDVVPTSDKLVVLASIDPLDIDAVVAGLPATIGLWAVNRRHRASLEGIVQTVSADRLVDQATGAGYYLARIELATDDFGGVPIQPGMSADVMVRTGARTPWDYITAPLFRSLDRAFRES